MKIRITIPKLKTIVITFISIAIVGSLSGAAYFVPKYLKEQQQTRDASRDCVHYRDFLLASDAWEQEGDTDLNHKLQLKGKFHLSADPN